MSELLQKVQEREIVVRKLLLASLGSRLNGLLSTLEVELNFASKECNMKHLKTITSLRSALEETCRLERPVVKPGAIAAASLTSTLVHCVNQAIESNNEEDISVLLDFIKVAAKQLNDVLDEIEKQHATHIWEGYSPISSDSSR